MFGIAITGRNPLNEFKERFLNYRCSEIMSPYFDENNYTLFCNVLVTTNEGVIRIYLRIAMLLDNMFNVQIVEGVKRLFHKNCNKGEVFDYIDHFMETSENIASKIGIAEFVKYWEDIGAIENL